MENTVLLIPLFGILFGTLMPVLIIWLALRYRTSRNQLVYETAIKLAEKGQPVPAELFTNLNPGGSDLRRGFVLIMLGVAICICLYELGVPWTFGLIPLLMGVGFLIVWRLESRDAAKTAKESFV
ncbi:MAG: hypothetical protein H7232_00170 [Aeromicrobium sp.]|nr:hypothetical protein [Burkholderiales bacterium]